MKTPTKIVNGKAINIYVLLFMSSQKSCVKYEGCRQNCKLQVSGHHKYFGKTMLTQHKSNILRILTLCIQETPIGIIFQTVKTQMKQSIMLHFIRVYTVCEGKTDLQTPKLLD